jgi:hypothetical protein
MSGTILAWLQPLAWFMIGSMTASSQQLGLEEPHCLKKKKKLGIRNKTGPGRYVQVMDFSGFQRQKLKNRVWMNLFISIVKIEGKSPFYPINIA